MKTPRAAVSISQLSCPRPSVKHGQFQRIIIIARVAFNPFSTSRIVYRGQPKKSLLPDSPARTRFAPSPTGYLHLGSLRTALFNYLLARKTNGQFILRVEDTDQRRTVPGAEEQLCEDLHWAGIEWDEGPGVDGPYGPYKQSLRTNLYKDAANKLLDTGRAYRCFCSADRLADLAKQRAALGLPTDYDRACASLSRAESDDRAHNHEPHVIRLLAPSQYPEFVDLVYGRVGRESSRDNAGITMKHGEVAYEDPILLKTDGQPTYHLANVVDDHAMQITHVVRATEWMSSTPKHLELYKAFDWTPPQFAHVGLLVDEHGQKLSKRAMTTDVSAYRTEGVLPETLANFVVLMGWSHTRKSDVLDLQDMLQEFRMKFTKGNTTVQLDKLWFLQRAHVEKLSKHPSLSQYASSSSSDLRSTSSSEDLLPTSLQSILSSLLDAVKIFVAKSDYRPILYNALSDSLPANASQADLESPAFSDSALKVYLARLLLVDARNYTTATQFIERNLYFFKPFSPLLLESNTPKDSEGSAVSESKSESESKESAKILNSLLTHLSTLQTEQQQQKEQQQSSNTTDFKTQMVTLEDSIKNFIDSTLKDPASPTNSPENSEEQSTETNKVKKRNKLSDEERKRITDFYHASRAALLNNAQGPMLAHVIAVLGLENTRLRIERYLTDSLPSLHRSS